MCWEYPKVKEELAVAVQTTRVMCPRRSGNGRKQELGASKNPGIAQGKEDPSSKFKRGSI